MDAECSKQGAGDKTRDNASNSGFGQGEGGA